MPFIQFGVKLLFSFRIVRGEKHLKDAETRYCYDGQNLKINAIKYLK